MPVDPPAPFHPTATRRVRNNNNNNNNATTTVRVGVGVVVVNEQNQIYAGIRKGDSHGTGTLALPGGHLEVYESWQDCAQREVLEEMNITSLQQVAFCHVTNDPMPDENKHYVTIFMMGRITQDQAMAIQNMEPDKCEGWKAFSWQQLQEKAAVAADAPDGDGDDGLFGPLRHLVNENPPALHAFLSS